MNIKEAKEQIKNAITAYFSKDEYVYEIPIEKQRPDVPPWVIRLVLEPEEI